MIIIIKSELKEQKNRKHKRAGSTKSRKHEDLYLVLWFSIQTNRDRSLPPPRPSPCPRRWRPGTAGTRRRVVHVGLDRGDHHLVHTLTGLPVEEVLAAEHAGELLTDTLGHLLMAVELLRKVTDILRPLGYASGGGPDVEVDHSTKLSGLFGMLIRSASRIR